MPISVMLLAASFGLILLLFAAAWLYVVSSPNPDSHDIHRPPEIFVSEKDYLKAASLLQRHQRHYAEMATRFGVTRTVALRTDQGIHKVAVVDASGFREATGPDAADLLPA